MEDRLSELVAHVQADFETGCASCGITTATNMPTFAPLPLVPQALCAKCPHLFPPALGSATQQAKSSFPVATLGRFMAKVRGTDSGGGEEEPVEVVVRRLVGAATSVDNLARMYEGWMPWV